MGQIFSSECEMINFMTTLLKFHEWMECKDALHNSDFMFREREDINIF